MTTTKRLISGTAASWTRIAVTIVAQILFVPVYLTHWNINIYGLWLGIQALLSLLTIIEFGHHNFLEFEFLKIGSSQPKKIAINLWSGVALAITLGLLINLIIIILVVSGTVESLFANASSLPKSLIHEAGYVLLILSVVNTLTTSAGGVLGRALSPFGYYSRMCWWGVWTAVLTTCAPVVAIALGADFLRAGLVLGVGTLLCNIPLFIDVFRILKKENIIHKRISIKVGLKNFASSLVISLKDLLESFRQQGIRVILIPIVGPAGLTAFSTTRTGANLALQGLNTITNPLMPELMRFLNEKDQNKMEVSFGTIWFIVIALLSPGMIILQSFVGPLFIIWTKGKIPFDPLLFATLSLNVLIYALSQPAIAVVRGNNLLKPQILISTISASVLVFALFVVVPIKGIIGAGLALMISEVISCFCYFYIAKRWLNINGLSWPKRGALLAATAVCITTLSLFGIVYFPALKIWICLISFLLLAWNTLQYYSSLPIFFKLRVKNMVSKVRVKHHTL